MDSKIVKVYINPNFNRETLGSSKHSTINANSNANYSSPHKKIYINPNFIPSISQPVQNLDQFSSKPIEKIVPVTNSLSSNTIVRHAIPPMNNLPPVATKSRYSLVRRNEDKALEIKPEKKESLTVKVNKYKSVRIIDVKSSLDREKQPPKQLNNADYTHMYDQKAIKININNPYNQKVFKTQYTYVKSKGTIMYTPHRLLTQYSYIKNKDMAKKLHTNKQTPSNMSMPIRNTSSSKIRKLKVKCNIPCRLFRKYGKCLRNVKGHCKYLHDKKHVSICRKFLKGVCHDKDCLLSHELSDKKMPTCFFYLQGMCTKDKCPYLHVKVNEKAIVCPDFKKGYCEKGNKCLYRHVETKKRGGIKILVNPKTKSTYQLKIFSDKSKTQNISEHKCVPSVGEDQTTISDCRYYKEVIVEDKTNELQQVIKPTRCKLGTLPSFIKF